MLKRNELRPVSFDDYGVTRKGYFHCFSQEGDSEQTGLCANIELENGRVYQVAAYKIKFEDVESLTNDE